MPAPLIEHRYLPLIEHPLSYSAGYLRLASEPLKVWDAVSKDLHNIYCVQRGPNIRVLKLMCNSGTNDIVLKVTGLEKSNIKRKDLNNIYKPPLKPLFDL